MNSESHPVGFFSLDATDEIVVFVGRTNRVVKAAQFKDAKGRVPQYMIEMLDGDRYFFTEEKPARDFMMLHGMEEVDDEQMEKLRVKDETDEQAEG